MDCGEFSKKDGKKGFVYLIISDEPWFYFECIHQSIRAQSRDEVPEKSKKGTRKSG
jgi:hypothetical protein